MLRFGISTFTVVVSLILFSCGGSENLGGYWQATGVSIDGENQELFEGSLYLIQFDGGEIRTYTKETGKWQSSPYYVVEDKLVEGEPPAPAPVDPVEPLNNTEPEPIEAPADAVSFAISDRSLVLSRERNGKKIETTFKKIEGFEVTQLIEAAKQ